jgi:carbamoyl-phosphate synthase large subunit
VLVSRLSTLSVANDKGQLYNKLNSNNVDVPEYRIAHNLAEAKEAIRFFEAKKQPFITKPCVGNGSRGFRIINQDISMHEMLFLHKPSSTYISSENLILALTEKSFAAILFSEYLPGKEYTVDCLVQNGVPKLILPRSRDKMSNGISVAGEIINDREIISYCEQILSNFEFNGPIGIQVKRNKNHIPLLVEINPRIQGTTVACSGAGVNLAALSFAKDLEHISTINDYPIIWGTKFIRHYSEEYYT